MYIVQHIDISLDFLHCFEISGEKYLHFVRVVIFGTDKGKQMHFSDLFLSRDENLKSMNYSVLCHSLSAELAISHLQICIVFFMQKSYRSTKSLKYILSCTLLKIDIFSSIL